MRSNHSTMPEHKFSAIVDWKILLGVGGPLVLAVLAALTCYFGLLWVGFSLSLVGLGVALVLLLREDLRGRELDHIRGLVQEQEEQLLILTKQLRQRDSFVHLAVHELKNPLNALGINLDIARLHKLELTPQKIARLRRQVSDLNDLLNFLADLTRLDNGKVKLSLEPLDLAQVVQTILRRTDQEAKVYRCRILTNLSPVAGNWDRVKLEQVVCNLVLNALRHGKGTDVEITTRLEDGRAKLFISNGGPGVKPEDKARIFEKFERGGSATCPGYGVGLWVVKLIVEAHKGTIEVESIQDQKTTFTVTLPLLDPFVPTQPGE